MNKNLLAATAILVMASFVVPASGYHIVPNQVPVGPLPPLPPIDGGGPVDMALANLVENAGVYSSDFVVANPILIICESDGPADPVNPNPLILPGIGGLCYSGQNPGTGPVGALPKAKPAKGDLERFDLCALPTSHRLGPGGTFPVLPCNAATPWIVAPPAATEVWDFVAQLGTFACLVLPHEEFYYSSRYAWMTYDAPVVSGNGHVSAFPDLVFSLPTIAAYIANNAAVNLPFSGTAAATVAIGSGDNAKVAALPGAITGGPCGGSDAIDGPTWVDDAPGI